ncbi:permease [Geosporobacter ferrireducens]|uniref:Permease n=1 Tax=Geosporobacter ferrireducens TaxID=1424294 RepID=A0A1D8GDG9_9FIRM|nr:permease [Geosporobacter ferrireducens]AOT68944.1 permease [Geosporobacter ferrireducens]MTI54815.1 permease [Geosporobacter ferrireducens]
MNMAHELKKNKLLLVVVIVYAALLITQPDRGMTAVNNSKYYIIEMLEIMPVIFILTALIEAWIPREVIMKHFSKDAGLRGAIVSFLLGSFSAGPIYAAFPVCKTLLKKGASISSIVIILSSWAVVKVPMLINEAKFLGLRFMGVRWISTTISIFIMAYVISLVVKVQDIPNTKEPTHQDVDFTIREEYCISCGICTRLLPQNFILKDGKVKIISRENLEEHISEVASKCPAGAIGYGKNEVV